MPVSWALVHYSSPKYSTAGLELATTLLTSLLSESLIFIAPTSAFWVNRINPKTHRNVKTRKIIEELPLPPRWII